MPAMSIEVGRMQDRVDRRRGEGPLLAFHVFFWDHSDGRPKACVVTVMTRNHVEAMKIARHAHPDGVGFCLAQGGVSAEQNDRQGRREAALAV